MLAQVTFICELFVAMSTFMSSDACVTLGVRVQFGRRCKSLSTKLTLKSVHRTCKMGEMTIKMARVLIEKLATGTQHAKSSPWLCFSTCQEESLTKQWTYGPTLLPWFDRFHTSPACFTSL